MIKLLHSGDWHLDSPLQGRTPQQASTLRRELLKIPGKIAALCKEEACDLVLLSGDLFDGTYTQESYRTVYDALQSMDIPVFITPGNHDYISPDSPYKAEIWPGNVYIFKKQQIEWVDIPALSLRVYGAGFESMDCPSLLENFRAQGPAIGVFHGDPTQVNSPCCPVTAHQVEQSGFHYLALGHIHKAGSFRAGSTLCAWPGCPMGRGYDEQGDKGVYIVTIDETADVRFVPLEGPRFYDLEVSGTTPLSAVLPAVGNENFYRVTLTGAREAPDLAALQQEFSRFPNLVLRDETTPPTDIWGSADTDTLEGAYFTLLRRALETADEGSAPIIRLAAQISRQLLDGQEVELP